MNADSVASIDPEVEFDRACRTKYLNGLSEYRCEDEPFVGNPLEEYADEQLDSANYLTHALEEHMISYEVWEFGVKRHFENWWWARSELGS